MKDLKIVKWITQEKDDKKFSHRWRRIYRIKSCRSTIEKRHKVIVIDNEYSDAHEQFYYNDKAEYHNLDILDDATRSLYDGVDYVFHIAAEARIGPSIENPTETVSINSFGTCTVLQFAREAGGKRVVYSSTSSAYGLHEPPHVEALPDDCLNP